MKRYGVKTFRRMCALALAVMGMLVLTACEGKTDINSVEQSSGQQIAEKNEDNRYTVVELPEELQTGEGIECKFYMRQGDFPYMIIGVKDKDCYIYKSYILTEEDTWEIRELEWSREFAKREKRCIYDLSIDFKGNYYALIREEDEKRNKETLFFISHPCRWKHSKYGFDRVNESGRWKRVSVYGTGRGGPTGILLL